MNPLCIYHSNCADGFGSAWVVRKFFGNGKVDFHPGIHQTDPPDTTDRDVIMVDFSYKRPVVLEMAKKASSILILDHHKSAKEDLVSLPKTVTTVFDVSRSGAMIAWEYYFPTLEPPPANSIHPGYGPLAV